MLTGMMLERLRAQKTFEGAVATLLHDVVALHGAEFGNVQLPIADELVIVAQIALSRDFLRTFKRVDCYDGSACGRALRERKTIIIPDVDRDEGFAPFRLDAKAVGFRAVQTTPLFTSDHELIGMVSTHFANVHEPTAIEMESLQAYTVPAADYLKELLAGADLAVKAIEMHSALWTLLDLDELETEATDLSTSPPTGPTLRAASGD